LAEAIRAGAHVDMLEKTIRWGGNSEKASSGMNAARTAAQIKLNLKDSVEEFYKYASTTG
jgi:succinate dehydrogenase/fumarate reductase flavoprotein subunit